MSFLTEEKKIEIIQRYDANPEQALNILVDLQFASEEGFIDQATARLVAAHLGLTETRIYEMITFYAILKERQQARFVLKICNSSPCHFSQAPLVSQKLQELLGVPENQPTADGLFMYQGIPCVGACGQDPLIKIKDRVFPDLTAAKIEQLIKDLRAGRYTEL